MSFIHITLHCGAVQLEFPKCTTHNVLRWVNINLVRHITYTRMSMAHLFTLRPHGQPGIVQLGRSTSKNPKNTKS